MRKIQFNYVTIPNYFYDKGCLDTEPSRTFILKTFKIIYHEARSVDFEGYEMTLEAYEFISKKSMAYDFGLTENQYINQIRKFIKRGLLIKTDNSRHGRFSCYRWNINLILESAKARKSPQNHPKITPDLPPDFNVSQEMESENHPKITPKSPLMTSPIYTADSRPKDLKKTATPDAVFFDLLKDKVEEESIHQIFNAGFKAHQIESAIRFIDAKNQDSIENYAGYLTWVMQHPDKTSDIPSGDITNKQMALRMVQAVGEEKLQFEIEFTENYVEQIRGPQSYRVFFKQKTFKNDFSNDISLITKQEFKLQYGRL